MSMLKLQGALLRGTESFWFGVRSYSSARAKEEARKKWACEQVELLEVLEARVKQLQADNVSEVAIDEAHLPLSRKSSFVQLAPRKAAALSPARNEHASQREDRVTSQPSRWTEKLNKEKSLKHKHILSLETKLLAVKVGPRTKVLSPQRGGLLDEREAQRTATAESRTESRGRPPKSQPANETKGCLDDTKATAVRGTSGAESLVRSRSQKSAPEKLRVPIPIWGESERKLSLSLVKEDRIQHGDIQLSILSYLDTCLFLHQLERAHHCLQSYHRSHIQRKLLDVRMYNLVMHGYAKKGCLNRVGHLFYLIGEAGLKPNLDSYATALSCMGRSRVKWNVITRCLQQLKEDGFREEDLFGESMMYEGDEEEMVLSAIQRVVPAFQRPPRCPAKTCTVPLLRDYYAKGKPVSYPKLDFTAQQLREQFQQQLALEASDAITIDSVEVTKPLTAQTINARKTLSMLRSRWRESLVQSLRESKLHLDQRKSGPLSLYPFLCVLKDNEYVDIVLRSISTLPPQGESLVVIARELGTKIYNRYILQKKNRSGLVEKVQSLYESYARLLAKDTQPDNYLPREYWEKLAVESGFSSSLASKVPAWPHSVLVQLGLHLVELMVQALKMETNLQTPGVEPKLIPVLYHVYSFRSKQQIGFIRPHPILTNLLLEAAETTLTFDSCVMPMLCPPVPWVSPHFGAYIFSSTKLMRCVDGALQHQLLLENCPHGDLYPIMDSLNQLGNCPWKVNQAILDIVISIFNHKGDEKLAVPPPPSEAPQPAKHLPSGQPLAKLTLKREVVRCRKKALEMYSLRMDTLYKLSIARHMKDRVFWFPHNMDFRGRTYPCPPHFNHLGNDLTRAILLFAEGKPLGPHGLDWLKIHLINLTGLKKKNSLRDRLAYANEIMADILDSADYPLTGQKWWTNSDEPWQTLACCMEIAKAIRAPEPAAYVSHFPVHQDGSCNGLQHYAALGRDVIGAASVNLAPCDAPQDVYSEVSQQVEVYRKCDAEQGVKIAQILDGFIGRKVVKQTVMTVVYGVTRFGGRLQIEKRLKEMEDFPQEHIWEASRYLVQQVFNSLKEMFSGTREIQSWLTESARLIAMSGRTVEWVTPLGMPVIQPYHRSKVTTINSSIQSVFLKSQHDTNQKPNTVKQKNAFPPNFIHSLDSSHMMLTALHCHRQGLTFVSVHDCYWTHALTVDEMNRVCRDQFVELHNYPILEKLSKFMLQKYCHNVPVEWKKQKTDDYKRLVRLLSSVPKRGDFDLEKVKESTYFFS
ncbi:DNA-directed RNA polymerase, mitochondrial [Rhineura floridana]|uniref:DNA-directed RNA polymerase, mitochondrial n=1 Tax=Rhineura floridana TaxID=261503 RepID=UPI002AC873D4|nr:DNA-directed RNA polymerase, mitochondrial [Rhineura floridana]